MLTYEGYLRGHLFGNYTVFLRKDERALEVVDVTSSNTLLQLNYHQQIVNIYWPATTKDKMNAVVLIQDKDNYKYVAIDFLTGNSRLLNSYDTNEYSFCFPPVIEETEINGKVDKIEVRATLKKKSWKFEEVKMTWKK